MKKHRFFIRFVLIYLCILLPLLITAFAVNSRMMNQSRDRITADLNDQLKQVTLALDKEYAAYRDDAILLFSNHEFYFNSITGTVTNARTAIRILKHISEFSGAHNTFLVYYGGDHFYYHAGLEGTRVYWDVALNCTPESKLKAEAVVRSDEQSITVLHSRSGDFHLLYHMPMGQDAAGCPRSLEVVCGSAKLTQTLTEHIHHGDAVFCLQVEGQPLWFISRKGEIHMLSATEGEALSQSPSLLQLEAQSSRDDFQITAWYDPDRQLAEYNALHRFNVVLLGVGFLLSAVSVMTLSADRIRRMDRLVRNLSEKRIVNTGKKYFSEFDYIQSVVNLPLQELSDSRWNAREYRRLLGVHTAGLLFHGGLSKDEEARALLKISGIELFEEYFFLYGLRFEQEEHCRQAQTLLYEDLYYICREDNGIYMILLQEIPRPDPDLKFRRRLAGRLRDVLRSAEIPYASLAVSQVYDRITKAGFAYYETLHMLRQPERGSSVQYWEEWIRTHAGAYSPIGMSYQEAFSAALEHRSETEAMAVVAAVWDEVRQRNDREYICSVLLRALTMFAETEGTEDLQEAIAGVDLRERTAFESGMAALLVRLFREPEKSFEQVLEYIHDNFRSPDLSLDTAASYAGVSISRLSKLFPARTGTHYLEYITRLRMEYAAELLRNSTLSVREVFLQVGYNDHVNAGRKFKKEFGMTPSDYRKQYGGDTQDA